MKEIKTDKERLEAIIATRKKYASTVTHIQIPKELHAKLKKMSAKAGMSMAKLIAFLVDNAK